MNLVLFHPGVVGIDCSDCEKYQYDLKTGKRITYKAGLEGEKFKERVSYKGRICLQCDACPKPFRQTLPDFVYFTYKIFLQSRATFGRVLTPEMLEDEVLMDHLAVIQSYFDDKERERLGNEMSYSVAELFRRST